MLLTSLLLGAATFAVSAPPPSPFPQETASDEITLTSGKKIKGIILSISDDEVVIGNGSKRKSYSRDKVADITGPRAAFPKYIQKLNNLFTAGITAKEANQLASWCSENGLHRDVDFLHYAALVAEPDNEVAHQSLGHTQAKSGWQARTRQGARISWDRWVKRREDFSDGWEIATSHFDITAGGTMAATVVAAAELEQLYATFYEQFQAAAGFYELQEPIKVNIYPDRKAYPPLSNNADAYWDNDSRILVTYFDEAGSASRLLHEACHALMDMSARELGRKQASFPGWLMEGLACWMETTLSGRAGALMFDPAKLNLDYFKAHHGARKRDGLTRVLNYGSGDFLSSTGQNRRYAQSYTLVHFLQESGDDELRQQFMGFLHSAWSGKGSTSHFKKYFGKKTDQLEKRWTTLVKEIAEAE